MFIEIVLNDVNINNLTYMLKKFTITCDNDHNYFYRVVKIICCLYFPDTHMAERELEFFAILLFTISKGHTNVLTKEFRSIFDPLYFGDQTKKQKDSLFCTVRKNIEKKNKFLTYNKNTGTISVQPAWLSVADGVLLEIKNA